MKLFIIGNLAPIYDHSVLLTFSDVQERSTFTSHPASKSRKERHSNALFIHEFYNMKNQRLLKPVVFCNTKIEIF